jgi:Na+/H+ antiporter NhaD/arsenite permease-like protein
MFSELYYWLYTILKKIKTNDNPEFNAFLGISSLQYLNIASLFGVANYFLVLNITKNLVILASLIVLVVIAIVNYYNFFSERDELKKKFEKFSPARRRKGQLFLLLYVFVTLILFIYVLANLVTPKY